MKINNLQATKANMAAEAHEKEVKKQLAKISSGIQVGAQDAASLMISDMLQLDADTMDQGIRNANDAIAYMQIADGVLKSVSDGTIKLNELSVAYNNDALGANGRAAIMSEANALKTAMKDSLSQATFNGSSVFKDASFYVGGGSIGVSINAPHIDSADVTNQDSIIALLQETDSTRAGIGATINQAYSSINVNLTNVVQKRSANSEIADTDMASTYTTLNSQLLQSNSAMFASAHSTSYLAMQASRLLS